MHELNGVLYNGGCWLVVEVIEASSCGSVTRLLRLARRWDLQDSFHVEDARTLIGVNLTVLP